MQIITVIFGLIFFGIIKETYRLSTILSAPNKGTTKLHLHHRYTVESIVFAFTLQALCTTIIVFFNTFTGLIYNNPFTCQLEGFTSCLVCYVVFYHFVDLIVYEEDTMTSYFSAMVRIVPCWAASFMWAILPILTFGLYWPQGNDSFCCFHWTTQVRDTKIFLFFVIAGYVVPLFYVIQAYLRFQSKKEKLTSITLHWIPKEALFDIVSFLVLMWAPLFLFRSLKLFGLTYFVRETPFQYSFALAQAASVVVARKLANALLAATEIKKELHHA